MKRLTQTGSHIVALAVGILVVGIIAFAGYTVTQRQSDTTTASTTRTTTANTASDADLTSAADELDTSSSQVDSGLDDSSLDADLNDML